MTRHIFGNYLDSTVLIFFLFTSVARKQCRHARTLSDTNTRNLVMRGQTSLHVKEFDEIFQYIFPVERLYDAMLSDSHRFAGQAQVPLHEGVTSRS
jgi:hypothetical protein